jgi:hypothetical protein
MENIERDDVKDEAKEKHLEEATMLLEKPAESKIYVSMYDWLFSKNSSPSAEAKGKLNPIKLGGGALCVEMGFTWTFPRNQDTTMKLKSDLISIKF